VYVWRKLRSAGAASLQNGVWILPRNPEKAIFMERLQAYVKQNEASSQVFSVQVINQTTQEDILSRFESDRNQEYDEFLEQCEAFLSELEKETLGEKFTFAELEENEQNLHRLNKWIEKIKERDFFGAQKSQAAATKLETCRQRLETYTREVYTREGIEVPLDDRLLPNEEEDE
jgi:vacuolar-type H+-ATPase subunit I/STV1